MGKHSNTVLDYFKQHSYITALWEKKTGKIAPELLPESPMPTREPLHTSYS